MINIEKFHSLSYNNKAELEASKFAACFHCLNKFPAKDVVKYKAEKHAECPMCKHDTVIGDHIIQGKFAIEMRLNKNIFKQLNQTYDTNCELVTV